jgi:hypothetical protein
MALLFRQTNIFWVAVFPAGLAVVELARRAGKEGQRRNGDGASFSLVIQEAWNHGVLYDIPVEKAWVEDYAKAVLSIGVLTLLNLKKVLPALTPFIILLGCFAAFVVWNGGVVLGKCHCFLFLLYSNLDKGTNQTMWRHYISLKCSIYGHICSSFHFHSLYHHSSVVSIRFQAKAYKD